MDLCVSGASAFGQADDARAAFVGASDRARYPSASRLRSNWFMACLLIPARSASTPGRTPFVHQQADEIDGRSPSARHAPSIGLPPAAVVASSKISLALVGTLRAAHPARR